MRPFPITYRQIKEMVRDTAIATRNARAIVRKAGVRVGTGGGGGGAERGAPILSLPGTRRVPLFAEVMHCGLGPKNFAVDGEGRMYGWGRDLPHGFGGGRFGIPGGATTYSAPARMHPEIVDAAQFATNDRNTLVVRGDGHVSSDDLLVIPAVGDEHWEEIPTSSAATQPNTTAPWTDVVMAAASGPVVINSIGPKYLLRSDGTVWGRGQHMPGAVGATDAYDVPGFTFIGTLGSWTKLSAAKLGGEVVSISARGDYLAFVRADGAVGTWREGEANPRFPASPPAGIAKMTTGLGCIHVLTADGEIWSAGSNSQGQAGLLASSSAAALGALSNFLNTTTAAFRKTLGDGYADLAATNAATFAVKDGRLYSWGTGGVISARGASAGIWGAPVEITDPDVSDVEVLHHGHQSFNGMYYSPTSGVHIWGQNSNGSLGLGYLTPTTGVGVPTQLPVVGPVAPWPAP